MTASADQEWGLLLSRLNSAVLKADRLKSHLSEETKTRGWCGSPPAPETEILKTEGRLGIGLPPSYRAFLSISNGWAPLSGFIERLLPVQQVDWFRNSAPEDLALLQECYQEDEISDEDYLDYTNPEHMEALRHRYYPGSLLIGRGWGGDGEIVLLNPQIAPNGEWEAIFFADWIPGNRRYRSFLDFVRENVNRMK